ncbi:hypothetical protein ABEU20_002614 [Rhodococcus sp. PAM 2766]|uniref:Uncharacterized protein n=1 Tax=Rhodococcus parequi TaxID=3137122 RepID=A0ABW9FFU1_9NOCA
MKKSVKPSATNLSIGQVLPDELTAILRLAADSADNLRIDARWKDGHDAHTNDPAEIAPIEDAANLKLIEGKFEYADRSFLYLKLTDRGLELSAKGETARDRLTTITERWEQLPKRGRLSWNQHHLTLMPALTGLTGGVFVWLVLRAATMDTSGGSWLVFGTLVIAVLSCQIAARLSVPARTERRLVILARRPGPSSSVVWTALGAIFSVGSFAIAALAYLKT